MSDRIMQVFWVDQDFWGGRCGLSLNLAREMGADVLLNASSEDVSSEIMRQTDGRGADIFFEMSGAPAAFEQGFKALRPGGTAVLFGLPSKKVEIDVANWIVFKDAHVRGVFGRRIYSTCTRQRRC